MSEPTISLGGNLPKDEEYNGLYALYDKLTGTHEERAEERIVVCKMSVNYVKDKTADGSKSPVLQIVRIEPMVDPDARRAADTLLIGAYEHRTRRTAMPFQTINDGAEVIDAQADESAQWEPGEIRTMDIGGGVSVQMTVLRGRFYVAPLGAPAPADSQPGTWIEYDDKLVKRLTGTSRQQDKDLRAVFMAAQEPSAMDRLSP
jgi:hypothetical protein